MVKLISIILSAIICMSCSNAHGQDKGNGKSSPFTLPKGDLNNLSDASSVSLIQVYDRHRLENREVTFRDERLLFSRGVNSIYEMPVYSNKEWEKRKEYLRKHILVSAGLWPTPPKNPLNPKYYQKLEHDNYIVETVSIETYPGYFLVGNLYRPKGKGPYPAILTPHGHFEFGRLNNDSVNSVPALCINFAIQGYVVLSYDMVGYNDTRQVPHTFANDSISRLYGINLLGLQIHNSIRAMDFLLNLPQVDKNRIGITGPSGGGTQTFLLTAVDDRFQAAAPVNMVSNSMQGGDLCENAPGLRTNTFNAEIVALVAPKPLLLISNTHDWTYNTRNTIFPMVKSVYHLYEADDKLQNAHFDYVHNYNKASREAAYKFFGKWLLHDSDITKFREKTFKVDSGHNLLAFMNKLDADRTKSFSELPTIEYHDIPNKLDEEGLKALLKDIYTKQLDQYWPKDQKSFDRFTSVYGTAFRHLTGVVTPVSTDFKIVGRSKGKNFIATRFLISVKDKNYWIPCILYQPLGEATSTVIVTGDEGKSHWVAKDQITPIDIIKSLLKKKCNVLAPDLFKQGEHVLQGGTMTRRDENAKFFTTYNLTDRQEQIQDLITVIQFINETDNLDHHINLYATGNTGITALLLSTITNDLNKLVVDGNHFDPASDQRMLTLEIPGFMRVGGLKTALALSANKHLLFYNADLSFLSFGLTEVSKFGGKEAYFSVETTDIGDDKIIDFLKP